MLFTLANDVRSKFLYLLPEKKQRFTQMVQDLVPNLPRQVRHPPVFHTINSISRIDLFFQFHILWRTQLHL